MTETKPMRLNVSLDLDDLWTGSEWDETIGELLRNALKEAIKTEMRSAIKNDKDLAKIVTAYKKKAIAEAMQSLSPSLL